MLLLQCRRRFFAGGISHKSFGQQVEHLLAKFFVFQIVGIVGRFLCCRQVRGALLIAKSFLFSDQTFTIPLKTW